MKKTLSIFLLLFVLMGFNIENKVTKQDVPNYQANISAPNENAVIIQPLPNKTIVTEGDNAVLSIAVSGGGKSVTWYHEEEQLQAGKKYDITVNGLISTLVIKNVQLEDAGRYAAVFENTSTTTYLYVIPYEEE